MQVFSFELCAANLQDWAASGEYNGPIPDQLNGLHQLAKGLAFVHDNQHVHRDICPANILIVVGGDRLIISDFGLCKRAHDTASYSVSNQYGQEKWRAPERIANESDPNYRVTIDSDTWALGCVFSFFITKGCHPFDGADKREMLNKIMDGKFNLKSKILLHSHRSSNQFIKLNSFLRRNAW